MFIITIINVPTHISYIFFIVQLLYIELLISLKLIN